MTRTPLRSRTIAKFTSERTPSRDIAKNFMKSPKKQKKC
jgi:hypothetical protein